MMPAGSDTTLSISPLQTNNSLSLSLAGWPSFFGVSRFYFYFVMLPPVRDIHWNRDACASSSSLGIFALLWRIHFQPQPFTWCCNQMILERARENPCVWQARREEERKEKTSEKHSPFARYHRLLYTEHVHPICRSRSLSLLRPSSEFDFALLCCVCVCVCVAAVQNILKSLSLFDPQRVSVGAQREKPAPRATKWWRKLIGKRRRRRRRQRPRKANAYWMDRIIRDPCFFFFFFFFLTASAVKILFEADEVYSTQFGQMFHFLVGSSGSFEMKKR